MPSEARTVCRNQSDSEQQKKEQIGMEIYSRSLTVCSIVTQEVRSRRTKTSCLSFVMIHQVNIWWLKNHVTSHENPK